MSAVDHNLTLKYTFFGVEIKINCLKAFLSHVELEIEISSAFPITINYEISFTRLSRQCEKEKQIYFDNKKIVTFNFNHFLNIFSHKFTSRLFQYMRNFPHHHLNYIVGSFKIGFYFYLTSAQHMLVDFLFFLAFNFKSIWHKQQMRIV